MKKVRHVLGISGGKDSAALAIYLKDTYPEIDMEYYCCDTGKELPETYELIKSLEIYLGKKIQFLRAAEASHLETPFDHFMKNKSMFLPSTFNRWCTKNLKLDPFESWVGDDPVVSYVGIRGDEDREGYISHKPNIQSIFPFRKNIWSEDVIAKVLKNDKIPFVSEAYGKHIEPEKLNRVLEIVQHPLSNSYRMNEKHEALLTMGVKAFNHVVFDFLQTTDYPASQLSSFPLTDNEAILVRDDIFKLLRKSGVGVPAYYEPVDFEIEGESGQYFRSRSGCFFCFYQQRIEWVWLYEQHPGLFAQAMEYEKDGYTWVQDESLADLIKPERIAQIKHEYLIRKSKNKPKSALLIDILEEAESEGCAACFI